jgi:membrane protein required for colicin V production
MYWLDTIILILLGLGAGLGFWSGLLWQIARVLSLGLALYATILFNEPATKFLDEVVRGIDPRVAQGIAYVVVFLGVYLSLFLLTRLLHKMIKAAHLELFDRLLGGLLGAAKMGVVIAIACAVLAAVALPMTQDWMQQSTLAPLFVRGTEATLDLIPMQYRSRVDDGLQQIRAAVQPGMPRRVRAMPGADEEAEVRD